MDRELKANESKQLVQKYQGTKYARIPVKTHLLTESDDFLKVIRSYALPVLQPGDVVFLSEKAVSCTQKRAILIQDIHPRLLAHVLSKFVYKNPYGPGLGMPETMEMVLRECGTLKVLWAGLISLVGKLFGQRGWFYNVAGEFARCIDTPDKETIAPYNECIVLPPLNPLRVCKQCAEILQVPVAIIDINDFGANIMACSDPAITDEWLIALLKDNPLGQASQSTPIGIIRVMK